MKRALFSTISILLKRFGWIANCLICDSHLHMLNEDLLPSTWPVKTGQEIIMLFWNYKL
jgi:hypothetical protein